MDTYKQKIIEQFSKEINLLDFHDDIGILEIRYNTIVENIFENIKKEKNKKQVPLHKTSNNNNIGADDFDDFNLCSGKPSETLLNDSHKPLSSQTNSLPKNEPTTIPNNFKLSFEMRQYAKSKYIQNVEEVFENFQLYYQSKGTVNSDWEATWKKWVLNQNRYTNHLIKTTIDEDLELKNNFLKIAQKYLDKESLELEFTKFKNHYLSNGDLKVSWERVWENWCINSKQFKPKEQNSQIQEKAAYKWNFRKAKDVSDRIKDWLEFEKGINWLDDYYWKGKSIPGIGWQKVMHPDFNKEEILLYKIDSNDGQFMLNHKSDEIIEIEVLQND